MDLRRQAFALVYLFFYYNFCHANSPSLTVIIVVDQFSYNYFAKLKPYMHGGIKFLLNHGTQYANAFYSHASPNTAPGHTMLATGTWGNFHGIVNNTWFENGKKIMAELDSVQNAAVFAPDGSFYPFGRSARNILVDGLSDQLIMHSYPHAQNTVYALSLKSRAAICTAGKLGHAIWFDDISGNFTSSKAYFKALPEWLKKFNQQEKICQIKEAIWRPFYLIKNRAYQFEHINNYQYSHTASIINKKFTINQKDKYPFDTTYAKTPLANKHLINLAKTIIDRTVIDQTNRLILWVSISSLDKVSHAFGPQSKETIDMIYQIDHQIGDFIRHIYRKIPKKDVLFLLTSDHGVKQISEILKKRGLDIAHRHSAFNVINQLNNIIKQKYGLDKVVQYIVAPQFYLDHSKLDTLCDQDQTNIYNDIKKFLLALPGIRKVWTFDELAQAQFEPLDSSNYIKRQLYKGRSGDIIYSTQPYTSISIHKTGTSHSSQYAYDRQVPLIFFQHNRFTHKIISDNVFIDQVAPTLARILDIPRPSASTSGILPGLNL